MWPVATCAGHYARVTLSILRFILTGNFFLAIFVNVLCRSTGDQQLLVGIISLIFIATLGYAILLVNKTVDLTLTRKRHILWKIQTLIKKSVIIQSSVTSPQSVCLNCSVYHSLISYNCLLTRPAVQIEKKI